MTGMFGGAVSWQIETLESGRMLWHHDPMETKPDACMQKPLRKLLILVSFSTIWPITPAQACIDIGTFKIEGIRTADAIFVGEPLAYERLSANSRTEATYAHLKVRVRRVLKGNMPTQAHLFWGSNFGIPEYLDLPRRAIFAVDRPSDGVPAQFGKVLAADNSTWSELFHLMDSPCSSEFILDDTAENIENIEKIVSGKQVAPHDYRKAISTIAERAARRRFEEERALQAWTRRLVVVGGLVASVIIAVLSLRRRRSTSALRK